MVANDVSEYDYDKAIGTYHTSRQVAGFLLELYDSEKVVGLVDSEDFCFRLSDPLFHMRVNPCITSNLPFVPKRQAFRSCYPNNGKFLPFSTDTIGESLFRQECISCLR